MSNTFSSKFSEFRDLEKDNARLKEIAAELELENGS